MLSSNLFGIHVKLNIIFYSSVKSRYQLNAFKSVSYLSTFNRPPTIQYWKEN